MGQRRARGFSLIELIVVLVITGLLLALVPPMLSKGMGVARFNSAVRETVAGLRLARSEAVLRGEPVAFEVDLASRRMGVPGLDRERSLPDGVEVTATSAADEIYDQTAAFRFFPDGTSTGGHILLRRDKRSFQVSVDWLTGRIDVAGL